MGIFAPISLIRFPSTKIIWLVDVFPVSGSTTLPALIAIVFVCAAAAKAQKARTIAMQIRLIDLIPSSSFI
jgi:hypothetical protein